MLNRIKKLINRIDNRVKIQLDFFNAHRSEWKSKIIASNVNISEVKLLIYVVHIHGCLIPKFIQENVKYWHDQGFAPLLIITFSNANPKKLLKAIESNIPKSSYILRGNHGKDFGGIGDAVRVVDLTLCEQIVLMNDSYLGPFYGANVYEELSAVDSDVVGVTESFDHGYHLQSSFLFMKNKIASKSFNDFFNGVYKPYNHRQNIVKYGEIGMSQYFLSLGLKLRAKYPLQKLAAECDTNFTKYKFCDLNSQHLYNEYLFTKCCFPYLKREAIGKNPLNLDVNFKNLLACLDYESQDALNEACISRL